MNILTDNRTDVEKGYKGITWNGYRLPLGLRITDPIPKTHDFTLHGQNGIKSTANARQKEILLTPEKIDEINDVEDALRVDHYDLIESRNIIGVGKNTFQTLARYGAFGGARHCPALAWSEKKKRLVRFPRKVFYKKSIVDAMAITVKKLLEKDNNIYTLLNRIRSILAIG